MRPPAPVPQWAAVEELGPRIAAYARHRMPEARDVEVDGVDRIHGGASRETFRFVLRYVPGEGGGRVEQRLVLRRDPAGSLIETDRAVEFCAYRAFHGSAVPVPEPWWLEEDPSWLGQPFFVMEEIAGYEAGPTALFAPPYVDHLEKLGCRKWEILGEISRADPHALGLVGPMEPVAPDAAWRRELDYWEGVLDEDEVCPQPVIRAVIRRLRREPPAPAQKLAVVHGDYRTGNFLYDTQGGIHAVLDWEMAHLGDPLEDLAWGINRVWCWARDDRVGGLLDRERAIGIWEESSGLRADREALRWWELFSCVKGQGIWVSSAKEYGEGKNQDPVLALSGWMQMNSQDRAALELLGHLR